MKRVDRMLIVFSCFLVVFAGVYGTLYLFSFSDFGVFHTSVIGLLLLVLYLFGEIAVDEIQKSKDEKEKRIVQRRIQQQKRQAEEKSLSGFRKLFGGEEYVE